LGRIHNLSKLAPRSQMVIWGLLSLVGMLVAVVLTYAGG
jgi:hypothetical protein